MTHRGGLSLSISIWRIGGGGGGKFPFALGPNNSVFSETHDVSDGQDVRNVSRLSKTQNNNVACYTL
jgi:hypothetical protein